MHLSIGFFEGCGRFLNFRRHWAIATSEVPEPPSIQVLYVFKNRVIEGLPADCTGLVIELGTIECSIGSTHRDAPIEFNRNYAWSELVCIPDVDSPDLHQRRTLRVK